MRNFRKLISILLMMLLLFSLAGCKKDKDPQGTPIGIETKKIESMPEEIREHLMEIMDEEGYYAYELDGGVLLFITGGIKPGTGYELGFADALIVDNKIKVMLDKDDADVDLLSSATSTPHALGVIIGGSLPREVEFYDAQEPDNLLAATSVTEVPDVTKSTVWIYFGNTDGYLVGEQREFRGEITADRGAELIASLLEGPNTAGLHRVLPEGTELLDYHYSSTDKLATVNFSQEIKEVSGTMGEGLAVYSVINTLTELADLERVQLLVNGEKIESIGGHIYIREPLRREGSILADRIYK